MQIIVTYDHVGYFNGQTDKLNTFQLAIYADSATNIAVSYFRYAPDGINWVTGSGMLFFSSEIMRMRMGENGL